MTDKNGETTKYRVGKLEDCYDEIDKKVDLILTNHLPHLQIEIARLRTEVRILAGIQILAGLLILLIQKAFIQ